MERRARRTVGAAKVEPEADVLTIRVYANLPNVYRMAGNLISETHSFLNY